MSIRNCCSPGGDGTVAGLGIRKAKRKQRSSLVRGTPKAKLGGRNELGVMHTNETTSLAGMVRHITEGLKSPAEKLCFETSVYFVYVRRACLHTHP